MIFKNLKEAHKYYNYPSSHRFGTIGNEKGVIRSYSNGKGCDYYKKNTTEVYYKIKNNKDKIVLIFGKGHENHQIFSEKKLGLGMMIACYSH